MDRRTMIENRLRAARSVTNATADVARSEIDGLHTEFETAFKIAARIDSASDQYIATAFEYGQALKKLKQLQSVTDTEKKDIDEAKGELEKAKKRFDELKAAFNKAEAVYHPTHAEASATLRAADAALARFHEHTQVSTRLIHTFAEFASGNAPGEDT